MEQQSANPTTSIHPAANIGLVTLRVSNLDRSLDFYQGILRFRLIERTPGKALLGAEAGPPLLELHEVPDAPPQPRWATGLYHVAILYPSRRALAVALQRLIDANVTLDGASDHGVSEALYLHDPDNNGLELYWDRPREQWPTTPDGQLAMYSRRLDLHALLREASLPDEPISDADHPPKDL